MFGYNSFELGILIFIVWFCVSTILGQICGCIERCAIARAVSDLSVKGMNVTPKEVEKFIDEQNS